MKKLIVLLLAVVCIALDAAADPQTAREIDSLYRILPSLEGEARLECYKQVRRMARTEWGIDSLVMLLDAYRKEAHKQHNVEHETLAISWKVICLKENKRRDEALAEVAPALKFMEANELWDEYYEICAYWCQILMHGGKLQDALTAARETYDFAKSHGHIQGMATALSESGRAYEGMKLDDEAMNAYKEALQLFDKVEPGLIGGVIFATYDYYIGLLGEHERYAEELEVARSFEALYDRYRSEDMTSLGAELNIDAAYINAYAGLGDPAMARKYLDHMAQSPAMSHELGRLHLQHNRCMILKAEKRFGEMLITLDSMRTTMESIGDKRSVLTILANKAMAAHDGKLYQQAADTYKEWKELADSVRSADNAAELNDLRTVYEVDKLEAQKRAQANYLWLACGIIALLTGLLAVWMIYARRVRRKNVALYHQIQELLQSQRQAEEVLLATPEEALSRGMQLFRRVGEVMQAEKLFTDPELNRKALADRLSTNESYLADAIREATGGTFSAYIAGLRLGYSLDLLAGRDELTLDAVAIDSGHGSYSSFFRAFTKQYGISPSEYRRLSAVKEK